MNDIDLKEARLLASLALSISAPKEEKRGRELSRKKKMEKRNEEEDGRRNNEACSFSARFC